MLSCFSFKTEGEGLVASSNRERKPAEFIEILNTKAKARPGLKTATNPISLCLLILEEYVHLHIFPSLSQRSINFCEFMFASPRKKPEQMWSSLNPIAVRRTKTPPIALRMTKTP